MSKKLHHFKLHGGHLCLVYAISSLLGHTTGWLLEPLRGSTSFLDWMEGFVYLPFSHISALFGFAKDVDSHFGWFTLAAWCSVVAAVVFFKRKDWISLAVFSVPVFILSFGSLSMFLISA